MSEVCAMAVKAGWVRIHIKRIPAETLTFLSYGEMSSLRFCWVDWSKRDR